MSNSQFQGWHNMFDGRRWHFLPNPFSNFEDESIVPPPISDYLVTDSLIRFITDDFDEIVTDGV